MRAKRGNDSAYNVELLSKRMPERRVHERTWFYWHSYNSPALTHRLCDSLFISVAPSFSLLSFCPFLTSVFRRIWHTDDDDGIGIKHIWVDFLPAHRWNGTIQWANSPSFASSHFILYAIQCCSPRISLQLYSFAHVKRTHTSARLVYLVVMGPHSSRIEIEKRLSSVWTITSMEILYFRFRSSVLLHIRDYVRHPCAVPPAVCHLSPIALPTWNRQTFGIFIAPKNY